MENRKHFSIVCDEIMEHENFDRRYGLDSSFSTWFQKRLALARLNNAEKVLRDCGGDA